MARKERLDRHRQECYSPSLSTYTPTRKSFEWSGDTDNTSQALKQGKKRSFARKSRCRGTSFLSPSGGSQEEGSCESRIFFLHTEGNGASPDVMCWPDSTARDRSTGPQPFPRTGAITRMECCERKLHLNLLREQQSPATAHAASTFPRTNQRCFASTSNSLPVETSLYRAASMKRRLPLTQPPSLALCDQVCTDVERHLTSVDLSIHTWVSLSL